MDLFSALALTGAKITAPSFSYNNKDSGQGAKCALPETVSIATMNDDNALELVVATVSEATIQKRSQVKQTTASAKITGAALIVGLQCARAGGIEGVDLRLTTEPGRDEVRREVLGKLKSHSVEAEQARNALRQRAINEAQNIRDEAEAESLEAIAEGFRE